MLVVTVIVIVLAAAGFYVFNQRQQTGQTSMFDTVIRNNADLTVVAADLDNTDTGSIKSNLNKLNTDTSSF